MIYVIKDNQLVRTRDTNLSANEINTLYPKYIPTDAHVYDSYRKEWHVKRTRAYLRSVPDGMLPKQCMAVLLLLGVPCG